MTPAAFVEKWFGRNPYPDGIHEEAMLADLDAVRRAVIEECTTVIDEMAYWKIRNIQIDGTRDSAVFEQGIGCEQAAQAIRRLGEE